MLDPLFDIPINIKGVKGDSAYEIWLSEGNTGSKKDFLDSLRGKDGDTIVNEVIREVIREKPVITKEITKEVVKEVKGLDGKPGSPGLNGKSAYELWKSLGNKGSVKDFVLSLRGDDGLSAYEIWLENGNNGTEKDFLDSLKGTDGRNTVTYNSGTGGKFGVLGAGEIGRLNLKGVISSTDEVTILRDGSLYRITAQNFGSSPKNYVIVSDDYTAQSDDYYIEVDTSNKTATLPTTNIAVGREYHIDNSSDGLVYVTPVLGTETVQLFCGDGSYFVFNGTQWRVK